MSFVALDKTASKIAPTTSFKPLAIQPVVTPPSSTILNNGSAPPDFSQVKNSGPVFTSTPQNTGFSLGNGSKQVAGIGDIIKAAAEGGANQSLQGVFQAGEGLNTGNPIKMGEGTLNALAGAINAVSSPLAPAFAPLGMATDYLGKQLGSHYSDNPIIPNDTATRIVQAILNAATIAGTFAGGAKEPIAPEVPTKVPVRSETPSTATPIPIKTVVGEVPAQKAGTSGPFKTVNISEISGIKGPRNQTIKEYSPASLRYAKDQIAKGKPLEPVKVSVAKDGSYRLEDGEHRIQAYKDAGITNIPIEVIPDWRDNFAKGSASSPSIPKELEPQASSNIELNPDEVASLEHQKDYVNILKDAASSHRANGLLKYFGKKSPADHTLDEILVQALGTSKKSARLDSIIGEHGFSSMDEAQKSLDSYIGLRKELADATKQLQGMKGAPKSGTSQTLKPIEGTGAIKTRGLSEGVEANAIEKKLADNFGDLPEYKQVSMKDQAQRAADLITSDPTSARAVALGEKAPPKGLLPESVFVAAEQKAVAEGDVQTLKDLANSKLASSATTMGQRIRTLGERDPESPLAAIQAVQKAREEAQAARGETPEKVTNTIKNAITKTNTKETWSSFIDSITC